MSIRNWAALLLLLAWTNIAGAAETRVKDITSVQGLRDNQLVGYGLVIGLAGSGDSLKNSPFTELSMRSMLQRMGVAIEPDSAKSKNVAAVVVTAILPPFVSEGTHIDVSVASLGDATSLGGGILVMTPLIAADGAAYAVAQGPVTVSGFAVSGQAASVSQGVPTSGRIPNGAIVDKDHSVDMNAIAQFSLELHNADFKTGANVVDAINMFSKMKYGIRIAVEHDYRTIQITRPQNVSTSRLLAEIGDLPVETDVAARIVIDEKNGTIVIGQNVRISPVAISHGNMTIKVTEQPDVSQPLPESDGKTTVIPNTQIDITQTSGRVAVLRGPTLEKLVSGLNKMGLKPPDIISIVQSIKSAGALQAELVIQ